MTDFPNISVLCPTYNRRQFLPLLIRNLKVQDYPHNKLELWIDDDGDEPFIEDFESFAEALKPIKLKLFRSKQRRSIGLKRNNLIKLASNNIVVFMDDDDFYQSTYISHSYQTMIENKAGCVGCDKMIFLYSPYTNDDFYFLTCGDNKELIHECSMMMTKKWFKSTSKFPKTSIGEGKKLMMNSNLNKVAITLPDKVMIQLCHKSNTIDKEQFKNNKLDCFNISEETIDFIKSVCQ
jgi:glycosyltransferase involved in cell wall biosynthesis